MAKRKKRSKPAGGFVTNTQALKSGIIRVEKFLSQQQWQKAEDLLTELEERFPNYQEVLSARANFCYVLGDIKAYEQAVEKLLAVDSKNKEAMLGLAGAYMNNTRPLMAVGAFKEFLQAYPDDEKAQEIKQTVVNIENTLEELIKEMGLSGENGRDLALLHEQAMSALERGELPKARQLEEQILVHQPDFAPAHNNISLSYWAENNTPQAIQAAQNVLDKDPDNFHALSNLCRFLVLNGQIEEAKPVGEKLKLVEHKSEDLPIKQAEALSYLGDDAGAIAIYEKTDPQIYTPLLQHLAAVAYVNQGNGKKAVQIWQEILEESPGFELAQNNLANHKKLPSEHHPAWAFPITSWITSAMVTELLELFREEGKTHSEKAQGYLQKHPELVTLIPILLERGDPSVRQFVLYLASMAETPEMLAILKDFALGDQGPDVMRQEAAQIASEAGLIPAGEVRMWLQGSWQEILLLGMEIHDEPTQNHGSKINKALGEAISCLKTDKFQEAEVILQKCLEKVPSAPDLMFNLSVAYEQQGREEEALDLVKQIIEQHPNYAFARINLARRHIQEKDYDAAGKLLKSMLQWKSFHYQEFSLYCQTQIEFYLAQNEKSPAHSWLGMWQRVEPDHPNIPYWQEKLSSSSKKRWGINQ
ncbi:MAG: tetratricopeptide repeat protein [Spirulinaceae cyanobacterium]